MTPAKFKEKNSDHDSNDIGFCDAPLKYNFTSWTIILGLHRDKQGSLRTSYLHQSATDHKHFKKKQ